VYTDKEKQYGNEGETEYEKQTVRRKEKRGWEGGMNERDRNSAIRDTGGEKNLSKKGAYFLKCHAPTSPKNVTDYKSCPMWSSNHVSYTTMQTYDYKNISIFWDVTPRSQAGMYQHFRYTS